MRAGLCLGEVTPLLPEPPDRRRRSKPGLNGCSIVSPLLGEVERGSDVVVLPLQALEPLDCSSSAMCGSASVASERTHSA